MRSVNATLAAALAAGTGTPYMRAYFTYADGSAYFDVPAIAYKLTGSELEVETAMTADLGGVQAMIYLDRGLTINGTTYKMATSRFHLRNQAYTTNGRQIATGSLFPTQYYSAAGDDTYQNVITAFCTH